MNKRGQSIVEYSLIAILVILGIVFMGPYVLRSVNAHFKLWDEGVKDSFEENLHQAPVSSIPPMKPSCSCTQIVQKACGSTQQGSSLCTASQHEVDWNCNPQFCNGAAGNASCQTDIAGCCTPFEDTGTCGSSALGKALIPGNCYFGYEIYAHPCGPDMSTIQCIPNSNCLMPRCMTTVLFPDSTIFCATGNSTVPSYPSTPTITQNYPLIPVTDKAHCPQNLNPPYAPTCQAYCIQPYTYNALTNACELEFYVADTMTSCGTAPNPDNNFQPPSSCSNSCNGTSDCHECTCTTLPSCGWNGKCTVIRNDESFTSCASSFTKITNANMQEYSCYDPAAASDTGSACDVNVSF